MDGLRILLIIWLTIFSINAHSQSAGDEGDEGDEIETPTQSVTPPGETATLGFIDDTLYDGNVTISVNLNGLIPGDSVSVTNVRDVELSFNGKYFYRTDLSKLNGVDIFVNGIKRINFNSIQYFSNPSQLYFKKHSFLLNRNWLQSGDNEVLIQNAGPFSNLGMETTDIRMEYNDPIQIKAEQKLTQLYGHFVGTQEHLTGLRVEFDSVDSDMVFSVTGFDIDSATEIAVFLNQQLIGYLKQGGNNAFNAGDDFEFTPEDFVTSGINTIEFVQTSSSSNEPWGVTNLELAVVKPSSFLPSVLRLLLDD